jgi:phosphoglycolate phosphatase
MYKNIIFDADGTLLDTLPGITAAFNYAMERMGRPHMTDEQIKPFMGPSLMDTCVNTLKMQVSEAERAVALYREFYQEKGFLMCAFFPGVEELLNKLRAAGKILCVATNKPQPFIDIILREKGYGGHFAAVIGADPSESSTDKTPLVKRARLDASAVMVGDRYVDIKAAKNAGVASIGVEWGSAEPGEFERFKPTHTAKTPDEVYQIVI